MQRDLIMGAYDNYNFEILAPWVRSIKKSGFTGDIVLVCFNSDFETVDKLVEEGVRVIACEKADHGYVHKSNMPIHTERFFHFFTILKEHAYKYNNVIITDAKDVIFQKNPSDWLSNRYPRQEYRGMQRVVVSSESIRYKDEPWGNQNMEQCFGPYFHEYFKHNEIYNVGVIAGDSIAMRDICLNIFLMALNRPIKIVDQAVWNAMLYTEPYKVCDHTNMSDAWAVHLGTTMDPNKIEQFRPLLTEKEPKIRPINHPLLGIVDLEVVNADDEPFTIVHQWDRIECLSAYYRKKYGVR
jgi:hypothetical protein